MGGPRTSHTTLLLRQSSNLQMGKCGSIEYLDLLQQRFARSIKIMLITSNRQTHMQSTRPASSASATAVPTPLPILYQIYKPLGRVVAIIDDKVEKHFGADLDRYFSSHGIDLKKLVYGGNEVDKDIANVEQILVDLKASNVARNEPVLVVGGGVIADIGGFACALYHRNTPYVMLCTSIVSGIDAGPSPRTCCDGFGYKNLYGAYD